MPFLQLSKHENPAYSDVAYMKSYTARESQNIKAKQAVDDDYSHTGYDRGHLNPNSYQCGRGRTATFTLTNSAPMDACFNRVHWKEWEAAVIQILKDQDPAGTAYLVTGTAYRVTGTVPSALNRIPRWGIFDDPSERDYNRVTVPTHIWTAVCYDHPDEEESFSFGYIGVNKPNGIIKVESVQELTGRLSGLYASNNLNIFADNCSFPNSKKLKSEKLAKMLLNTVQLPMENRLSMSPDVRKVLRTALSHSDDEGQLYPTKRVRITDIKVDFIYNSVQTWMTGMKDMKFTSGVSCLPDTPFYGSIVAAHPSRLGDELRRKRQTSQELVCRLIPEVLDDCSTSCLYIDQVKDYYCSTGDITVRCSPTYSDITVEGQRCNSDHTCGHHGWDYYWCNTGNSWNYCSPPLPLGKTSKGLYCNSKRNCAHYGSRNMWCDIGDSWDYCTR